MKLDWDEMWLSVANVISKRSACSLFQAGAVIVNSSNRVISTGYNGPPAASRLECQFDCPRPKQTVRGPSYGFACISIHAEANALLFADRADVQDGTLYVNGVSCEDCAKLICNSGIAQVIFIDDETPHRPAKPIQDYWSLHGIISHAIHPTNLPLHLF